MKTVNDGPYFCIADPEIESETAIGHYHVYNHVVCEAAERLGYRTLILGRKVAKTLQLGGRLVIPTFTLGIWETKGVVCQLIRDLRAALLRFRLRSNSFMFFPSPTSLQLPALAIFGFWSRLTGGPKLLIFLRYQYEHYDHPISLFGFRLLERLVWAGQVRLVTDSDRLANDYSVLTRAPVDVVPIPHGEIRARPGAVARGRPLRFGTLGGARGEKGICEFIDAIGLLNSHGLASNAEFVLHVHSPSADTQEKLDALMAQLPRNVTLVDKPLNDDEYAELLGGLDVLVLPYWRSVYRSRTSGALVEGIAAGKIVIVTRDTWLDDEMKRRGAGVVCADRSAVDLARSVLDVEKRFGEFHEDAAKHRSDRSPYEIAEQLVKQMTALFSVKRTEGDRGASIVIAPYYLDYSESESQRTSAGKRIQCLTEFLSLHSRVVCVAAPSGMHLDGPRNMIIRPLCKVPEFKVARLLRRFCFYRDLKCIIRRFDRVFIESARLAAPVIRIARRRGASTVLTNHNEISGQTRTPWLWRLILSLESRRMRAADHVVTVTKASSEYFAEHGVRNLLIQNCVDPRRLAYFLPIEPATILRELFDVELSARQVVLSVGSRSQSNNEAALDVEQTAAAFDEKGPEAPLFVVVGERQSSNQRTNFLALGLTHEIMLSALYAEAALVLASLPDGTGMPVETIEAMALGKAILGTRASFPGLNISPGVEIEVEDEISLYPQRISSLLANAARRKELGDAAQRASEPFLFWNAMKAYAKLVSLPEKVPTADPAHAFECKVRVVMSAVSLARLRERHDLADRIERWWLKEALSYN